jgi:hypothetical protein
MQPTQVNDRAQRRRPLLVRRRRGGTFDRSYTAISELDLPPAVFKTCPWQPRALIETGLRQWLRCSVTKASSNLAM